MYKRSSRRNVPRLFFYGRLHLLHRELPAAGDAVSDRKTRPSRPKSIPTSPWDLFVALLFYVGLFDSGGRPAEREGRGDLRLRSGRRSPSALSSRPSQRWVSSMLTASRESSPRPLSLIVFILSQAVILAETAFRRPAQRRGFGRRFCSSSSASAPRSPRRCASRNSCRKIVQATSGFLNADRSSLFLFDERHRTLWSLVAQGLAQRVIRLNAGEGIAGTAFETGETINVLDADKHPKFQARGGMRRPAISPKASSPCRSSRATGRRLGVMQTLNRLDGRPFDDSDVQRLARLHGAVRHRHR